MRSIKNRVSTLERKMGLDSVPVDPQHYYLFMERVEIALALSEASGTGRESDFQELQKKLADNGEKLWPYRNSLFTLANAEGLAEALERASMMRDDSR